jgi:hypothetical protein
MYRNVRFVPGTRRFFLAKYIRPGPWFAVITGPVLPNYVRNSKGVEIPENLDKGNFYRRQREDGRGLCFLFQNINNLLSIVKRLIITARQSYGLIPALWPEFIFYRSPIKNLGFKIFSNSI